jgi:hypothetical protein
MQAIPPLNLSVFIYYIFLLSLIKFGNVELRKKAYMMAATLADQAPKKSPSYLQKT